LRGLRLEVPVCDVYITNQFQNHFYLKGAGEVKSVTKEENFCPNYVQEFGIRRQSMDYGALPQPTRVGNMNNVEGSIAVLNQGTVDNTGTVKRTSASVEVFKDFECSTSTASQDKEKKDNLGSWRSRSRSPTTIEIIITI
jgi:hypothetical protein